MAYFAKLNSENIVETVIAINNAVITDANGVEQEQLGVDFINQLYKTNDVWKKTSYNTKGGKYYNSDNTLGDQSKAFRKNYGGIGYTYDVDRDAFIPPKPFNSFILNEQNCIWESSIPYPIDGQKYSWNEETQNWILQTF